MDPISLKRPKPDDDEEELFRMQEEFLKSNHQPAATVINLCSTTSALTQAKSDRRRGIVSLDLQYSKVRGKGITTSQSEGEVLNAQVSEATARSDGLERICDSVVDTVPLPPNILLGNIVERTFDAPPRRESSDASISDTSKIGFPRVFSTETAVSNSKQSLFRQHVESTRKSATQNLFEDESASVSDMDDGILVTDSWAAEISKANIEILSSMSPEEIMEEKEKLQSTLNPALIKLIKARKKRRLQYKQSQYTDYTQEELNDDTCKLDEKEPREGSSTPPTSKTAARIFEETPNEREINNLPKPPSEIIQQAEEKGWIHMDTVESEKLEWMQEIRSTASEPDPEKPYNARFDFSGVLLPFTDESLTVDKGLHHHGEEPERPGYTLQELLQLSRSSTQQQRCMALNTLANIMAKSRQGWYDQALRPPPLPALNEKNIFLLLRFSLDDSSVAVVTPTLLALRSFFFSEADEICLDRLMGLGDYKEPCLAVPSTDVGDMSSLKDHELAQLDTVAAAIGSDIVLRIRYILSEMRPPPSGVTAALEILVRLARYSFETAVHIACTPQLLETIIQHFIPLTTDRLVSEDLMNDAYGVPVLAAIRLCRILVCYGGRPIAERLYHYKVLNSLLSYITGDSGKHGINLGIESLRLWKMLLLHGVGLESVGGAQLTILSQLRNLLSNHDIGSTSELACEHAAALITVAGFEPSLRSHVSTLLSKWSTQLARVASPTWGGTKLVAMTLMAAGDIAPMKPLLSSHGPNIFSTLCSSSNLLSGLVQATERDPSSLPSLGVLAHEGRPLPAVSYNSCIPFLATVLSFLSKSLCKAEIRMILVQPQFRRYIDKLESLEWSLERCWYTRMELSLVTEIVRGGTLLGDELDVELKQIIWKLSIKLISALPADAPLYAREMVHTALSREKLKIETLLISMLNNLKLNESLSDVNLDLPENLARLYEHYIMRNGSWEQAAMPKDWLYLPLVNLYTECRNNHRCGADESRLVAIIFSLELTLPELVEKLSPSLRYSRLILAYLCDTVFLDKNVSPLLTRALSSLMQKTYKDLNLNDGIPGLNSFTDLFTALCEHFSATSYGDEGFGMALLVPLAQRFDVHYRKLLWSEHAGALRSLRTPCEKLAIPLREYLYPIEDDVSLVECYLIALARGTVWREWCPVMYTVALHHTAMNLKPDRKMSFKFKPRVEKLGNVNLRNELLDYVPPDV